MDLITVYYRPHRFGPSYTIRVSAAIASKLGLKPRQTINADMLAKIQAEQKRGK